MLILLHTRDQYVSISLQIIYRACSPISREIHSLSELKWTNAQAFAIFADLRHLQQHTQSA